MLLNELFANHPDDIFLQLAAKLAKAEREVQSLQIQLKFCDETNDAKFACKLAGMIIILMHFSTLEDISGSCAFLVLANKTHFGSTTSDRPFVLRLSSWLFSPTIEFEQNSGRSSKISMGQIFSISSQNTFSPPSYKFHFFYFCIAHVFRLLLSSCISPLKLLLTGENVCCLYKLEVIQMAIFESNYEDKLVIFEALV